MQAARHNLGKIDFSPLSSGESVKVGPLEVRAFSVSHDAADPQVYVLKGNDDKSLGIATDLGVVTHLVRQNFLSLSAMVVEFNHDLRMLLEGPYPWPLKQRVRSRHGHLSNEDAALFLTQVNYPGLRQVVLGHLSETNNNPELALAAADSALRQGPGNPKLAAAGQWEPTPIFEI
jgi:phosphoribosyl 1,2-cyclic phosphodiesterase